MAATARETWAKHVEKWVASGTSAAEFAGRHKLSEASLKWWKWRLGSRKPRTPTRAHAVSPLTFVEMTAAVPGGGLPGEALEVILESGARVRVPAGFDAVALGRLLDVLERRR